MTFKEILETELKISTKDGNNIVLKADELNQELKGNKDLKNILQNISKDLNPEREGQEKQQQQEEPDKTATDKLKKRQQVINKTTTQHPTTGSVKAPWSK